MEHNNLNKNKKLIIATTIISILILGVFIFYLLNLNKITIAKSIYQFTKEQDIKDITNLFSESFQKNAQIDFDINLSYVSIPDTTVSGSLFRDSSNKIINANATALTNDDTNISLLLCSDDTDTIVSVPELADDILFRFKNKNIDTQYENSILNGLIDLQLPKDLSLTFFPDSSIGFSSLEKRMNQYAVRLLLSMKVNRVKESVEITSDGSQYTCHVYKIIIQKKYLNLILSEEEKEPLDHNVTLNLYLDKNKNIIKIETENPIHIKVNDAQLEFSFHTSNMLLSGTYQEQQNDIAKKYTCEGSINYNKEQNYLYMDINDFSIYHNQKEYMAISGTISANSSEKEIHMMNGDVTDIFEMNFSDYFRLFMKVLF